MSKDTLHNLLDRTNLSIPFSEVIFYIEQTFPSLGKIQEYTPINEGYEDANILLTTDKGKYVLKLFLKERSQKNIQDYINVLSGLNSKSIPTIQLVKSTHGYLEQINNTFFMITEFFEGSNFTETTPTLEDIRIITSYLAQINTLQLHVEECYDSWGNKNLLKEYQENEDKLSTDQKDFIKPVIENYKTIDFSNLTTSFIHGDMQRKHVLKNNRGEYCILDFGCMSYGSKVIDLSTFIAWFCLQPDTIDRKEEIEKLVITEYSKTHNLSSYELEILPTLVAGAYTAYFMKTAVLITEGDASEETLTWNNLAKEMLSHY